MSGTPYTQPGVPGPVSLAIASGTSLTARWTLPSDNGGTDFTETTLEWYTSQPTHEVQTITVSGRPGLTEIQSIETEAEDEIDGHFTITFDGEETAPIRHDADAAAMTLALENLQKVDNVAVSVVPSRRPLSGAGVDISLSSPTMDCHVGGTCAFLSELSMGDSVWIAEEELVVLTVVNNDQVTFTSNFMQPSVTGVTAFRWANGQLWTVTFSSHLGPQPLMVATPGDSWSGTNLWLNVNRVRPGLQPVSGTFVVGYDGARTPPLAHDVSAADMDAALEQLTTVGIVDVARNRNANGHNRVVTFTSNVGDLAPMEVSSTSLSGPDAEVSETVTGVLPGNYDS